MGKRKEEGAKQREKKEKNLQNPKRSLGSTTSRRSLIEIPKKTGGEGKKKRGGKTAKKKKGERTQLRVCSKWKQRESRWIEPVEKSGKEQIGKRGMG